MQNYEGEFLLNKVDRADLAKVLSNFQLYRKNSFERIDQRFAYISILPPKQQKLLEKYTKYLKVTKQCVEVNKRILDQMTSSFIDFTEPEEIDDEKNCNTKDTDLEEIHMFFKQIVRDWTVLGVEERDQCYKPILDELTSHFKDVKNNEYRVLVPGAGLGRLVYEVASRGFYCEGNEFSTFTLVPNDFILNKCIADNQFELYPFCHQFMNNLKRDDPLKCCRFPDVSPQQNPPRGEMKMVPGDFVKIYGDRTQEGTWDCVCSCFFIDCANNIVEFLEIIHRALKPGGIFINYGPLLYFFCDMPNELSIEPSYEDLREIIENIGFEFIKESTVRSNYGKNA